MTISSTRIWDWFLLLICNFIWSSQFVLVKIVQRQMGPVFATSFPIALATLMLIPIVRREQHHANPHNPHRMPGRDILDFVMLGVLGQVVAQLFVTWGVRLSLASNAALIMLALPITTALMAYFILDERMTMVRWISFVLAIAGVLSVSVNSIDWKELRLTDTRFLLGNMMIFLSVNGSSFYNVYSKRVLTRYSPLQVLLYSCYTTSIFLLPITVVVEPQGFENLPHFSGVIWLGLILLAVFQYALSMVIFLHVLARLDATQAGLSNYLIPFFGVIIAALVLGERLTKFMVIGGILVLGSTLLITAYEDRQRVRAERAATAGQ